MFTSDVNKELTPKEVDALIDNFAREVVDSGFEGPVYILIQMFSPLTRIIGSTFMIINAPIMELVGIRAYDFAKLMRDRSNIDKIISRIDELTEEREREKQKNQKNKAEKNKLSILRNLISGKNNS